MTTFFVCTLLMRGFVDGKPFGYFHCQNDVQECFRTQLGAGAWRAPTIAVGVDCEGNPVVGGKDLTADIKPSSGLRD